MINSFKERLGSFVFHMQEIAKMLKLFNYEYRTENFIDEILRFETNSKHYRADFQEFKFVANGIRNSIQTNYIQHPESYN